ncbi:MAG: chemoreceptor glutamine deamidase CheD [Spongiibacteraceae bacterium]|nr:chemoreceptor glutamine deamidase CheD [Spongiibacteraceae bacterium]
MRRASRHHQPTCERCIPGFEHINRYWDKTRQAHIAKILPGEFYVTQHAEFISTTLGSCVSACIWDVESHIGGMNHFMLPLTKKQSHEVTWGNVPGEATRYGNYAMEHLINEILTHGGIRKNLQAKVFGGGKIFTKMNDVGKENSQFVIEYLGMENIPILSQDLMERHPRKILFQPLSGRAMMKKIRSLHNDTIATREISYQNSIVGKPVEGDIELF